jgi:hypothetical protein
MVACASITHAAATMTPPGGAMNASSSREVFLYGAPRKTSIAKDLHAGPVSVKFADAELRYLYVGDKEIVRRVYFGVRDERWDTVMPELSNVVIDARDDRFRINFDATCKNDVADYSWKGAITGDADGKITFSVTGAANSDFQSPRLGINILFGSGSLAGQDYELLGTTRRVSKGSFPKKVSYDLLAGFNSFSTLRYTTADGMTVSAGLDTQCVGMEDQRNFGDSSYKAFSSMPYDYPLVAKGSTRTQVFTLTLENPTTWVDRCEPTTVTIGKPLHGTKIPKIVALGPATENDFRTLNHEQSKNADADRLIVPFNPAAHMPDEDTFMENVPTLLDWVHSIRSFAPKASLRFDPIGFDSPYPRPSADPRNEGLFAASWSMRVMKYLALGGVDEAAFSHVDGYSAVALHRLDAFAGREILQVEVSPGRPSPIDALGVEKDGKEVVWLMNLTDRSQTVSMRGLAKVENLRLTGVDSPREPQSDPSAILIPPYEVIQVTGVR